MLVILDTQVLFLAKLTHVGRWTQLQVVLPTILALHQLWASSTSSSTWSKSTPPPKVCNSILEKLYPKSWVKAAQQDVNTSKCLNKKWQPHFELKRWVWPMIKCLHLTPKSIYSNIGDFVADHLEMKFSCVSPSFCLLHICFPFQKKLHLEILVSFLSFFVLHFLHSIHCKSFSKFLAYPCEILLV